MLLSEPEEGSRGDLGVAGSVGRPAGRRFSRVTAVHLPSCSPDRLFLLLSLREKLKSIAEATYTHSRNLAYFVFTYKGLMALQSRLQGKKVPFHSFFAACIGGWLVFGDNNPVNSQVSVRGESFRGKKPQQLGDDVPGSGWRRLAQFWWFLTRNVTLLPYSSLHKLLFWLLCAQTLEGVVCLCEQAECSELGFAAGGARGHSSPSCWVTPAGSWAAVTACAPGPGV